MARRLSFETIGSISAIVVGIAAVLVSLDQARTTRRAQEAAVLPLVKIQTRFANDANERSFLVEIANIGTGPAFVEDAQIVWDGGAAPDFEAVRAEMDWIGEDAAVWTGVLAGNVLGMAERQALFEARWAPDAPGASGAAIATAEAVWSSLDVEACYCSVFEQCWRTQMNRLQRPEPVARCDAS